MHAIRTARSSALVLPLLAALALTSACAGTGSGAERGHELTQARDLPHFARVVVQGPVEVHVQVGTALEVSVRADQQRQEGITTEVVGDTLTIRLAEGGPWVASIEVGVPHLSALTCGGGASARIAGLVGGQVEIDLEGNGSVWASGRVNRLVARVEGPGRLDLDALATRDADVRVRGSGIVEVTVSGALDAAVEGAGKVVYHGDPIVWSETSSAGSISRR